MLLITYQDLQSAFLCPSELVGLSPCWWAMATDFLLSFCWLCGAGWRHHDRGRLRGLSAGTWAMDSVF